MEETRFLKAVLDSQKTWLPTNQTNLASLVCPEQVAGGRRKSLLRGDINLHWGSWFIASLVDSERYDPARINYAQVFGDVLQAVKARFHSATKFEQEELARAAAEETWRRIEVFRSLRKRGLYSREDRFDLLDRSGSTPHCWICGYRFHEFACQAFLDGKRFNLGQPLFVDLFKPLGLSPRDQLIEIDHVFAWSLGGDDADNLRLACGWCNSHKSSHQSIYDVAGGSLQAGPNRLQIRSLPQKFWIVRVLAVIGVCEHEHGCNKTVVSSELTVETISHTGAPIPSNLRVVCADHHHLGPDRLLSVEEVRTAWGAARK